MALHGSLLDFDISYILTMIAQEGKTGILNLVSDTSHACIVFKNGSIISARFDKQTVQSYLYKYLYLVKKVQKKELAELKARYAENQLRSLSRELVDKKYMTEEELSILAETAIVDCACMPFDLKQGTFEFESIPATDNYQIQNFSISTDAITMEAARRIDEWKRFCSMFDHRSVFIRTDLSQPDAAFLHSLSPLQDFTGYLLYVLINGTASVHDICQKSFFSEYQIYEHLFNLLQQKSIAPLTPQNDVSENSAQAAAWGQEESISSKTVVSTIICVTFVITVYFVAHILIHGIFLAESHTAHHTARSEIQLQNTQRKITIASLHYRITHGSSPEKFSALTQDGMLTDRDISAYIRSSKRIRRRQ